MVANVGVGFSLFLDLHIASLCVCGAIRSLPQKRNRCPQARSGTRVRAAAARDIRAAIDWAKAEGGTAGAALKRAGSRGKRGVARKARRRACNSQADRPRPCPDRAGDAAQVLGGGPADGMLESLKTEACYEVAMGDVDRAATRAPWASSCPTCRRRTTRTRSSSYSSCTGRVSLGQQYKLPSPRTSWTR